MEDKGNTGSSVVEAPKTETPTKRATKSSKAKPQRAKAPHPPTSEMVHAAIKELKDRKGSSVQAIKKYIATTYKVDGEKFAPFIKRYLKSAVSSGAVVQTRGKGASGSFKLNTGKLETKAKIKAKPVKKTPPKKEKSVEKKTVAVARKPAAQKKTAAAAAAAAAAAVKKAAESKKAAAARKPAAKAAPAKSKPAAPAKSVSKSKKTAKAPAAKTKAPKPKKAAPAKSAKASAKK